MPTQSSLPPLLTPYLPTPESSLSLISSVLAATGNWLILRYIYAALDASPSPSVAIGIGDNNLEKGKKVILVSFLRNWDFWKTEAKKLGLDLARLAEKGQFAYVDGLSELFCAPVKEAAQKQPSTVAARAPGSIVPTRTPQSACAAGLVNAKPKSSTERNIAKRLHLSGDGTVALDGLERDIVSVIDELKNKGDRAESDVILIVDQPDLLLAATGPCRGVGATEMTEWVMGLQQHVHSTILALSADSPLIHNTLDLGTRQATPLEVEHLAFTVGSAHRARLVMQLRSLETGAASDVSGVLRISKGGSWEAESDNGTSWEEKEVLYFVQRDGSVTVFGRGET